MHVANMEISGIRGFSGDRSVQLDLTRPDGSLAGWTVLAGRNGSGKSTLLQALALLFVGPGPAASIQSLSGWMSNDVTTARMAAALRLSPVDSPLPTPFKHPVTDAGRTIFMEFEKPRRRIDLGPGPSIPAAYGVGIGSFADRRGLSAAGNPVPGWFYAGYGPFRHLGTSGAWRQRRTSMSWPAGQIASLFDESASLADAVDWLIEQHLYHLEGRPGAAEFIETVIGLLGHGLLPDGFRVSRVDSDGLWVEHGGTEFPLREMSDGYRAVTALVVDIIHQMTIAYSKLELTYRDDAPTLPYPGVVLIDEVDAHLHVSWQKMIGTWLKKHFPEVQFIVTTHSPYACQSADPGGLILLPGPGENKSPRVVDQDLYERVVYGSGDDAVLSELFGAETPYSDAAEKLRRRLADLEIKVLDGSATDTESDEYERLSSSLTSSLTSRVDEIAARLGRQR